MESSLIRVLPACLSEPLPGGWEKLPLEYQLEVMPEVERPEVVALALRGTEPDVLLLDMDFPEADIFKVVREALEEQPSLAIILLSRDGSESNLRKAMLSGVEEYLVRPFTPEQLREKLLNVTATRTLRVVKTDRVATVGTEKGILIGVLSGKGGLGKTTVATNLAAYLAKQTGQPTGMIGFESGDGAVLLSLQPRVGLLDMAGATEENQTEYSSEFFHQFGTPYNENLTYWTWQGTSTNEGQMIPDEFVPLVFEACRADMAYTFIDFPLLNEEELSAIAPLLDIILVVSSAAELLALRSTKSLLENIPEELHPRVRIIVNRSLPNDMISAEDFEEGIGHKVTAFFPDDPTLASQSINLGAPFVTTQNQSELTQQFRSLANQLFRLEEPEEAAKPRTWFGQFLS